MGRYPSGPDAVNRAELFKWPLWPAYLKIHRSFTYENHPLSEDHTNLPLTSCVPPVSDEEKLYSVCSRALVLLEEVHHEIVTGSLTFKQLHNMEEQKTQLCKLCDATSTENKYLRFSDIESSINTYNARYIELMRRKERLNVLVSRVLSYLTIKGICLCII